MNFLAPAAFLFALTIPVVVVFYLLKRKRVVKLVSSTLLWQKFLAETQASAPFQKLRRNWLLILQIIMLILAVLALSRPYFATKSKNSELRVLILDASASMQSTDETPSRFEKARKEALDWVDSLRPGDKMVVLQVAATAEVKQPETSEKSALRRAILSCAALDSPTRLVPALKIAESLVRDRGKESNPEIHLFSDGAVPDMDEFANKALPLVYHRVGQGANNLGITALDVRANPDDASHRAIYVSVANFSTNAMESDLELKLDGQLVETKPVKVAPGEVSPQIFLAAQTHDGIFTVHLTVQDDLAADNQASVVSLLPHPVKVLLVSRGNRLLEKALRAASNVQLTVATDLTDDAADYDFVTLDDVIPTVWPKANVLAIHVANTNWFDGVSQMESPPVVDSPQSPLIVGGDLGRQRILWVGFDVLDSDWPLRISFPIFIANAADWLNPATERNSRLLVRAGDPFRLSLPQPVTSAQITLPDGASKPLKVDTNANEIVFGETYREGVYKLKAGTNETAFCVALLDAAESNIKPREELS